MFLPLLQLTDKLELAEMQVRLYHAVHKGDLASVTEYLAVGDLDVNVWPNAKIKPIVLTAKSSYPELNDCVPLAAAIHSNNLALVEALLSLRPDQELNAFVLQECAVYGRIEIK